MSERAKELGFDCVEPYPPWVSSAFHEGTWFTVAAQADAGQSSVSKRNRRIDAHCSPCGDITTEEHSWVQESEAAANRFVKVLTATLQSTLITLIR
jgi:hypothetical protein